MSLSDSNPLDRQPRENATVHSNSLPAGHFLQALIRRNPALSLEVSISGLDLAWVATLLNNGEVVHQERSFFGFDTAVERLANHIETKEIGRS